METKRWSAGLAVGALTLALAPAAMAQSSSRRPVSPAVPGYQPHHGGGGGTYIRQMPPPPLGPNSLGLIEQGFQAMRNSSPRPNEFLYGRWNPRYEVVTQPHHGGVPIPGGYYYPSPYPPVYGYPGYPYGYAPYGYGYGYGYQGPVIQREVIIYGQGQPGYGNPGYGNPSYGPMPNQQPGAGAPPQRPQTPTRPTGEDFYLRGGAGQAETLSGALDEIRKAWLNGDFERFQSRVRLDGKLKIFVGGEQKYSMEGREFAAMIKDAMAKIDTLAFEFERPKSEEGGRATVAGKHTFLDQGKQKQTTSISYTLERVGGSWKIVEAGSAPAETPLPAPPAR